MICAKILLLLTARLSAAEPVEDAAMPTDAWYVIRFDDQAVGYERVTSQPIADPAATRDATPAVQRHRETRLRLKRFGTDLSVTASLETTETADGRLLSFSLHRTDASGATIERSGTRQADSAGFAIEERVQATRRKYKLTSPPDVWSPIISGWISEPMFANVSRDVRPVLFPETAGVAGVVVESGRNRTVRFSDRRQQKLLSASFYPLADPGQRTTLFIDDGGVVILQENTILGGTLKLEKTTAEDALSAATGKSLDLDAAAIIPVDRVVRNSTSGAPQVFEIQTEGPLRISIPEGPFQRVEVTSDRSASIRLLTVDRSRRNSPVTMIPGNHLPPTRWMPTLNPLVQRLARSGAVGETDAMQLCLRLERFLHSEMRHSAFSTTMLPADQVARTLRGDCTEHAVLLAAMIRVHGVPSRVVSGLIPAHQGIGFTGHMWTEAKIGNNWIPFDSTLKSSEFEVPHIHLADSELPDEMTSGVTLFIPVLDLTGRTQIRVLSE